MNRALPIYDIEQDILRSLRENNRLIIQSPTGSGKSTQVPQIILQHKINRDGAIFVLQPRRIAARLLAVRVAKEIGTRLGDEVGYQVRFEDVSSEKTKIKYITEGILLRLLISNPLLNGINVVVFDEFHERHLYGDITLARILKLQRTARRDLKIIVMSATVNLRSLQEYLHPCPVITSEGRTYPVKIEYFEQRNLAVWEKAAKAFSKYRADSGEGDVLIFMPGAYEIRKTIEALEQSQSAKGYILLPLHSELPNDLQEAALARYEKPKIVISTNVAETSITIDGVKAVIDSGLARIPRYDPHRGVNILNIEKISQSSAEQRAGRAGRTAPGICIRLWDEIEHQKRLREEQPEILRLELSEVALILKATGIKDLRGFHWLTPPQEYLLKSAETLLYDLGAIDEKGDITEIGRKMLAFPVHPRYSRMLIEAGKWDCVYLCAMIAALNQGNDIFVRSAGSQMLKARKSEFGRNGTSDFFLMIMAYEYALNKNFDSQDCWSVGINSNNAKGVERLFRYFLDIAKKEGLNTTPKEVEDEVVRKCVLTGFSDRIAKRLNEGNLKCEMVHGGRGELSKASVVQKYPLFVAAEINEIGSHNGSGEVVLSKATAIDEKWISEMYPNEVKKEQTKFYYDRQMRAVLAEEEITFRGLCLRKQRKAAVPCEKVEDLLINEIMLGNLNLTDWDESLEQWILRVNLLARLCPEFKIKEIGEKEKVAVLRRVCSNATSYKEIKDREVKPLFFEMLNSEQHRFLEMYAPQRLKLSNGRTPKVIYVKEGSPYFSLRIQELYGVDEIPKIVMGRVDLLIHILAPNMRPVQITSDIKGFWVNHYPSIKQQLQRKYPKHLWK
ncbi:MAG: ATP-dependent helicase HrpB [Verrucomicrobiia bacterium]